MKKYRVELQCADNQCYGMNLELDKHFNIADEGSIPKEAPQHIKNFLTGDAFLDQVAKQQCFGKESNILLTKFEVIEDKDKKASKKFNKKIKKLIKQLKKIRRKTPDKFKDLIQISEQDCSAFGETRNLIQNKDQFLACLCGIHGFDASDL